MEEVTTHKSRIACDGGTNSTHPRVWLQIDPKMGSVTCPYCSRHFIKREESAPATR